MRYVVDTNVPIVANGNKTAVSPTCRLAAIDFLESLMTKGILVLDLAGEIEAEYGRHLSRGEPGVGNRFLQAFLVSAAQRVERHELKKSKQGSYENYPTSASLRRFDPSDRKFVALSLASKAPIANAADSDWLDFSDAMEQNNIKIHFVCGKVRSNW